MNRILSVFLIILTNQVFAQTATLNVLAGNNEEFKSTRFNFNGTQFTGNDTGSHSIKLEKTFDRCEVIINADTLNFLLKFKPGYTYTIKEGCCCAVFLLEADSLANRGTVVLRNRTNHTLIVEVAAGNIDSVDSKSIGNPVFAHESAMCYYKPASISVSHDGTIETKHKISIETIWFHFLHGEQLTADVDKRGKMRLQISGYLTKEELEEYFK